MPLAAEVDPFQRKIGRDESIVIRRNAQNSAVITDSSDDAMSLFHLATDASNQRFFCERQGEFNYSGTDRALGEMRGW